MLKTIGYFGINKLLELWYNVLKPFVYCVLFTVVSLVSLSIIGNVVIALIDGISFHDTAYTLTILRGLIVGGSMVFLVGVSWCIYDAPIKSFIKSNWELAKKRQFYTHK